MFGSRFGCKIFLLIAVLFWSGISAGAVRIMPLGDSVTEGVGSTGDVGYRRALYLSLIDAGYDVNFVGSMCHGTPDDFDRDHEGHYAWYADQIRDNIYSWLMANPADIILLHIGTNDIVDGQPVCEIAGEINEILDNIDIYETDHNDTIRVVIAKIIDRFPNSCSTIALNDEIQSLYDTRIAAGDHLMLVDMQSALDYETDMYNWVHPNDCGYIKMADVWQPAVEEAIISGSTLTADIDNSGIVDFNDFSILASEWNMEEPDIAVDIVEDGVMDYKDLAEFYNQWLSKEPWYIEQQLGCK
jgi:lysophospholipase L1-like esterase